MVLKFGPRINFPSDSSFHDFKKQRDKFYALIRSWGENPRGKDYHFSQAFGLQVDDLLRMHHHTVNYSHFCTLFLQQLLAMCRSELILKEIGGTDVMGKKPLLCMVSITIDIDIFVVLYYKKRVQQYIINTQH